MLLVVKYTNKSKWNPSFFKFYKDTLFPKAAIILLIFLGASLLAQMVKNLPAIQETWVWSLGWENPLEKGMLHNSVFSPEEIPWTEESGRLQIRGPQRIGHTERLTHTHTHTIFLETSFFFLIVSANFLANVVKKSFILYRSIFLKQLEVINHFNVKMTLWETAWRSPCIVITQRASEIKIDRKNKSSKNGIIYFYHNELENVLSVSISIIPFIPLTSHFCSYT